MKTLKLVQPIDPPRHWSQEERTQNIDDLCEYMFRMNHLIVKNGGPAPVHHSIQISWCYKGAVNLAVDTLKKNPRVVRFDVAFQAPETSIDYWVSPWLKKNQVEALIRECDGSEQLECKAQLHAWTKLVTDTRLSNDARYQILRGSLQMSFAWFELGRRVGLERDM
eukprot:scaffold4456_cov164-Amphora_coffeaeformis.AAC.9